MTSYKGYQQSLRAEVLGYAEDVGGGAGVEHGMQLGLGQRDFDDVDDARSSCNQLVA